jgi:hypothetical protein
MLYYAQPEVLSKAMIAVNDVQTIKTNGVVIPGNMVCLDEGVGIELPYYFPSFPVRGVKKLYFVLSSFSSINAQQEYYTVVGIKELEIVSVASEALVGKGKYAHIQDESFSLFMNDEPNGALFKEVKKGHVMTEFGNIDTTMLEVC